VEAQLLRHVKSLMQLTPAGRPFGLMCVRVDATEAVDALLGPDGVERLHSETFNRLRQCVRTTDVVSSGPDGLFFILATEMLAEEELDVISERIQRTCRQPYRIHDQEIRSGLTAGGVGGSEGESDPTLLTQHAVLAMRRAASHGVPFEFFSAPQAIVAPESEGAHAAAAEPAFELNFHPLFTRDLALTGIRASVLLPRSTARTRKSAADREREGKQERLGDQVLRELLLQGRAWRERGLPGPPLAMEIGANHLLNPGFADSLLQMLRETGTPRESIDLLLSEATTLSSMAPAERTLATLTQAGVRFGLCGFSLNAGTRLDLRKLPFTSLRVSCKTLFKVTSPREALWLARSIVGVAKRYRLDFVGEDVETAAQRDILLEGGCEHFEGPLFSKPVNAADMEKLLLGRRTP
jgi:EAL domain-containing protein (putative c-di-GMP-specific phosphodiesterase class I)